MKFVLSMHCVDILPLDDVQAFVMNPKKDLYGLGFDPFKDAPEFRGMDHRLSDYLSFCLSKIQDLMYCSQGEVTKLSFTAERKRAREEDRSGHGGWKGHALSLKRPSLFRPNGKASFF